MTKFNTVGSVIHANGAVIDGNVDISGDVDLKGKSIKNVGTPTNASDVATKGYVDSSGGGGAEKADKYATINTQTGTTYTLVLADAGKCITLDNAAAIAVTIPANASVAFPVGTYIELIQLGAGKATVGITSDTLRNTGITSTRTQNSCIAIRKISATVWVISGDLG